MLHKTIFAAALSSILAGCMSAGKEVDPGTVSAFERGRTTFADVVGKLGTPNANFIGEDGMHVVVYTYTRARMRPESFIPLVGPLVGGADATTTGYEFKFDRDGVLAGAGKTIGQTSASVFGGAHTSVSSAPSPVSATAPPPRQELSSRPGALQRPCTQAEAAQKRIAIEKNYSMIPNCE